MWQVSCACPETVLNILIVSVRAKFDHCWMHQKSLPPLTCFPALYEPAHRIWSLPSSPGPMLWLRGVVTNEHTRRAVNTGCFRCHTYRFWPSSCPCSRGNKCQWIFPPPFPFRCVTVLGVNPSCVMPCFSSCVTSINQSSLGEGEVNCYSLSEAVKTIR